MSGRVIWRGGGEVGRGETLEGKKEEGKINLNTTSRVVFFFPIPAPLEL